tara:strand:- start:7850 stop:8281 length:432 start_codon:yes stop_codon:yes gene_type:complete
MKDQKEINKRTKCCGACPFKRKNNLTGSNPGGSEPEVYLGQTRGPFWLPCHKDKNYDGKTSDISLVAQCAGAAIFRSNCGFPYKLPKEIALLPKDTGTVFANEAEFYAHYKNVTVEEAKEILTQPMLDTLLEKELNDIRIKKH